MTGNPYREVFENLGVALFVHDVPSGRLVLANPSACELYGRDEAELRNAWPELLVDARQLHVDPREAILQAQHGPPVSVEWPACRRDGSSFWAGLRFRCTRSATHTQVLIEVHDVSTRRSAMRALAASERDLDETHRMLRSVLDAIPTRVFWKDRELRFLGCNTNFARDAGLESPTEVVGLDDNDLPWCEEAELYQSGDRAVIDSGQARLGYEEPQTRVDGSVAWLRSSKVPLEDAQGRIIGVLGTYDDITEHKASVAALSEREADLRITLDSIGDGVISTDNQGCITRLNPVAERLTGWSAAEAVGQRLDAVYRLFDSTHGAPIPDPIARARCGGSVDLTQDVVLRARDGRERHIVDSGAEIRDQTPTPRGVVVAFRDVSEARALQHQLHQAQKMEAVGELAGGVAHDFNNLMQVILGSASLLLEEFSEDHPDRSLLQDVVDAAERASTLTRQLLTFSRREPVRITSLDLNPMVEGLAKLIRRVLGELIHLELQLTPNLPHVQADAHQLELALMSLCLNARSAMPNGGQVRVSTRLNSVDDEQAGLRPGAHKGLYVVLAVHDEGPGVDPEHLSRLFEPFFSVNPEGQGTGLGLAAVDAVAQLHGGFVHMETHAGEGAQFELHLPLTEQPSSSTVSRPTSAPRNPRDRAARILIAEDNASIRSLGSRVLKRAGYEVVEAVDGQQAEELFLSAPDSFDGVVLDVVMPRKNGQAVYRTIKEVRPDLPVLFCSAYSVTVLEAVSDARGYPHLLTKPYLPDTLLSKLEELL